MTRISWLAAVAVVALGACAQTGGATESAAQSLSAQTGSVTTGAPAAPEPQAATPGAFTDAQLTAFSAASAEIDPISRAIASQTPEQQAQSRTQIAAALQRNNIDASTYNAIAAAAQTDQALATRIAAAAPGAYSDTQLRAFVRAAEEIDPINRSIAGATPEARAQAATRIRAILDQNGLDAAAYNAIATRAQTDAALAGRIEALRTSPGEGE